MHKSLSQWFFTITNPEKGERCFLENVKGTASNKKSNFEREVQNIQSNDKNAIERNRCIRA